MRLQTIEGLIPALDGMMFLDDLVARRGRFEHAAHGKKGLAVVLIEGHGHVELPGFAFFSTV